MWFASFWSIEKGDITSQVVVLVDVGRHWVGVGVATSDIRYILEMDMREERHLGALQFMGKGRIWVVRFSFHLI